MPPTPEQIATMDAAAISAELASFDAATLEALIRRTNREYWEHNAPTIPDPLYDRLVETLRRLQPDNPVLDELGESVPSGPVIDADATHDIPPEQRLGAPVRHTRAMLSLDKCYNADDLVAWAGKFQGEILVMPKMDGVACSLRYDSKGKLFLAATRGSGTEGEDITVNALDVADIPATLKPDKAHQGNLAIEVRGELFMKLSTFQRYAEQYSNPRNLTAGAIKHKERGKTRAYTLSFFAYDVLGRDFVDERQKFELLGALGFAAEEFEFVSRDGLPEAFERWSKRRSTLDYEIDGVVYRAVSVAEQNRLGFTGHHPRWSIAFKFQGDSGTTVVEDIIWSVSRTGVVTPVALFKPIELSGANISRASLHNLNRFDDLGLSKGAIVEVTRRGGVIPNVERMIEPGPDNELFTIPTKCPACNGEVERRKKREGEFLWCKQPDKCVSARMGELIHFVKVIDIQGFGPKVVQQPVDAGLLSSPADFYTLRVEDLEELDRLGRKTAQNLVGQVEAHKTIDLAVFLQSLGIEHLGKQNAIVLAENFRTLAKVREVCREDLLEIRGFKDAIADAICKGLAERSELIAALLEHVTVVALPEGEAAEAEAAAASQSAGAGKLAGKSFLFTGALEAFTRKEAEDKVTTHGGVNASGVSKTLDYLVVGAGKGAKSSKQKKAEQLLSGGAALQIIGEQDFLTMIGEA